MSREISILLVNPWIFDFAAYNLWIEPLGLEYIASLLKMSGVRVSVIDCLNSKLFNNPREKPNGCSKFKRTTIPKPVALNFVKRHYAMYGISTEEFFDRLKAIEQPDVIMVTSIMTYWYPGVFRTIELLRDFFGKRIPILLGGIYASLCKKHAEAFSGADIVYADRNISPLLKIMENITEKTLKIKRVPESFKDWPIPDHWLFKKK